MDRNNREKIKRFQEQQDATFGTLYKVVYIKSPYNYGYNCPKQDDVQFVVEKLTIENINGYGIGTLFFTNKDNRMVVLPWSAIISMIPVEEKEISNYAR